MKKIIALISALILSLGLSVGVFASDGDSGWLSGSVVMGGDTYFRIFRTKSATLEVRSFLERYVASKNNIMLLGVGSSSVVELKFLIVPDGGVMSVKELSGSSYLVCSKPLEFARFRLTLSSPLSDGLGFEIVSAGIVSIPASQASSEVTLTRSGGDPVQYIVGSTYFAHTALGSSATDVFFNYDYEGRLILEDDGDIFGTPDSPSPSEPDPPSSSAPPYVPSPPPDMGSGDSPYIPYDTDVWWDVVSYIRTAVGSATNIIFMLLAFVVAVPLIYSMFKHFISGGSDSGGGDTI